MVRLQLCSSQKDLISFSAWSRQEKSCLSKRLEENLFVSTEVEEQATIPFKLENWLGYVEDTVRTKGENNQRGEKEKIKKGDEKTSEETNLVGSDKSQWIKDSEDKSL